MKQKIDDLEGNIWQVEEENTLLHEYNRIFEVKIDKLYKLSKVNLNDTNKFVYLNQLLIFHQQNNLKKD